MGLVSVALCNETTKIKKVLKKKRKTRPFEAVGVKFCVCGLSLIKVVIVFA